MARNHQSSVYGDPNPPETLSVEEDSDSEEEVMAAPLPAPKRQKQSKQTVIKLISNV